MLTIREAKLGDDEALLELLKELQEHERQFEPNHRSSAEMARDYLPYLKKQCEKYDGRIYIAELNDMAVGLLCVWRGEQLDEYMAEAFEIAYVSDLIVSKTHRKVGIGSRLMAEAEAYASERNLRMIKIGSLARNYFAKELYRKLGYRDYAIQLIKDVRSRDNG